MHAATVWGWEGRFEDVGRNCKKYVDKRWKENMKEYGIEIVARERSEGIRYWLTAYVNSPEHVERIAEDLFHVALFKGSAKVNSVNIYLFDSVASSEILWRKSIDEVKDEFKKFLEEVARKFASDPRVEPIARAKRVKFNTDVCLLCELGSAVTSKVTIDAIHWNFF